jgi:DNA-binding response OmpR family regulator
MVIETPWSDDRVERNTPNVVVVDPQFDAYRELAASARSGRIGLHLRSSGAQAMKLARNLEIDAWIVAAELDDMSGHDFVELLGSLRGGSKVAIIGTGFAATSAATEAGADLLVNQPITVRDLEELLGLPVEERSRRLAARGFVGSWAALPVSVGAAVVALAVLMIG